MALPFDVWLDTELKTIHTSRSCSGTKIPSKYGYLKMQRVSTVEQARELDQSYRACDRCKDALKGKNDPTTRREFRYKRKGGE